MATNPYFSQKYRPEQDLYEDLIIESIKMYGQDVYYLPREIVESEDIFLDSIQSQFSDAYKVEVYIENAEGFEGEGDLFTKFGIELRDQATFVIARRRWKHLIGDRLDAAQFRPREGDVIYLPLSESLFQVMKVETESPFYQLSQLPLFRMQCELFEFSDEDFDTGIPEIDNVEVEGAFQYELKMPDEGMGREIYYLVGEDIYQEFDDFRLEGEVTSWNHDTRVLKIAHTGATDGKYHEWATDRPVIGENASLIPISEEEGINEIDRLSQKPTFNDFAQDFVDFSESNPFGDLTP
tara:strand:- start:415 stop:1299 length:885 start_codon:yes stop_codon:yes gene_type:complete